MAKKDLKLSKDDKIQAKLRRVDESKLKIVETGDTAETEIRNPTPEQLYTELEKSECTVYFYKTTDGSARKMRCTLNQTSFSDKYRSNKQIKNLILSYFSSGKHGKQGLVAVWDLDAQSWRSFYLNRVFKLIRNEQTRAE